MAKRKIIWSSEKLKRYIKEGRGTGEREMYKPWLNTQDIPSNGRASRLLGNTTGRVHHFFSDTQRRYFLLLDFDETITDIKEQYPLLDLTDVVSDDDLNLSNFQKAGRAYVMTTTFLITKQDNEGNELYYARSVKYASSLKSKATLESLEIQRRYWQRKGVDWKIVTNKDIDIVKVKNIEWLNIPMSKNYLCEYYDDIEKLIESRYKSQHDTLWDICSQIDSDYEFDKGTTISVFKKMVATRVAAIDLSVPINIRKPMKIIFRK